ncbi:hypothetical protein [Streptomyces sp. KL116D]|uniref:hypothetical protein n=1 Tax=Streptomyces sp. KL116D TaxID=3045152 RepID=UPI0035560D55
MKTGLGRALAGVCVAVALAATAACGGGGDAADNTSDGKNGDAKPAAKPALKPLTEAELTEAAVTKADVPGYRVGKTPDEEIPEVSVAAKPASCQAIADMFLLGTEPDATARVSRSLGNLKQTDATVIRAALLAHQEADTKKIFADLREQSETCKGFEHTTYQYTAVKPQKAPDLGDESLAYTMTGDIDGTKMPMSYTVVRSGSTLVVFYAANMLEPKKVEVPASVMEAQVAKVEKVTKAAKKA